MPSAAAAMTLECPSDSPTLHDDLLSAARARAGQCPSCGVQLYKVKRNRLGFLKRSKTTTSKAQKPLSIEGQVMRGQCLACMAHDEGNNNDDPEEATRTVISPDSLADSLEEPLASINKDDALSTASTETDELSDVSLSSNSHHETSIVHAAIASISDDDLVANSQYIGEYNEYGNRHGKGELIWSNGDHFEGNFWNGVREGHGTLNFASGGEYVGGWENNKMHGHGTQRSANGDVYTGQYVQGKRSGQGRCYFANGDLYVGGWHNDKLNGRGVYHYNNGQRYEGTFTNNKRNGMGKYQWCDGRVDIYQYVNDIRGGEGVRWSANRKKVWKVVDGKVKGKVSFDQAREITRSLAENN